MPYPAKPYLRPKVAFHPNRWETAAQVIRTLNLLPPASADPGCLTHRPAGPGYRPRAPLKSRLRNLCAAEIENVRAAFAGIW